MAVHHPQCEHFQRNPQDFRRIRFNAIGFKSNNNKRKVLNKGFKIFKECVFYELLSVA
jgi:hypothetical protein